MRRRLAAEEVDGYVAVPQDFANDAEHFALTVAGRLDDRRGHLQRRPRHHARAGRGRDGDIVAALLPGPAEEEATVKRLGHDGDRVMLIPENPTLEPFEMVDGRILGKVVAVMRKL